MNPFVLRNLSYGVYIVSTLDHERPTGCVANSIMQITSNPQTVAISINHDNYTNQCIKECGRFAVSILAETSDSKIIGTFGFQSGKTTDKFNSIEGQEYHGLPVIKDACGFFTCKVIDTLETATHTIFLGEITDGDVIDKRPPMTYAYYHQVVKGKSPKNAPTYIAEEETIKAVAYHCTVCGYIYDGAIPFEELPEEYHCPVCQVLKERFEKK